VSSRESRVTGQLTDASRGSRVKKCDPLSCSVSSTDVVIEHCHRPGRQVDDDKFLALTLASTCIGLDVEGNLLSFQLR